MGIFVKVDLDKMPKMNTRLLGDLHKMMGMLVLPLNRVNSSTGVLRSRLLLWTDLILLTLAEEPAGWNQDSEQTLL
jgi:hypothetical protein